MQLLPLLAVSLLFAAPAAVENGRPAVSPDGSRILFVSNRGGTPDVYVINADGSGEVRLTNSPDDEGRAQWTADGKRIWLFRFADDATRISILDRDGSHERQVGRVPGRAGSISPDGKRVIHWTGGWTAQRLMISRLDGNGTKVVNDGKSVAWGTQWSADGKQIAFGSYDAEHVLRVFVMNADGTNRRPLTHLRTEEGSAQMPAWSRDGRRIAFQADHDKVGDIWVIDADGSNAHRVSSPHVSYADETPFWFPDGKQISYQSNRSGLMQVWIMNADGTEARQVTK
jgi:Tol biopolymer transport system component